MATKFVSESCNQFAQASFFWNGKMRILEINTNSNKWQFIIDQGRTWYDEGSLTLAEALAKFCKCSPENVTVSGISLVGSDEILTVETFLGITTETLASHPTQLLVHCNITIS